MIFITRLRILTCVFHNLIKTRPYTPFRRSKSLTKITKIGPLSDDFCPLKWRFLTPTLFHRVIRSRMLISNFSSSTRWLFQFFPEKMQNDTFYFKVMLNELSKKATSRNIPRWGWRKGKLSVQLWWRKWVLLSLGRRRKSRKCCTVFPEWKSRLSLREWACSTWRWPAWGSSGNPPTCSNNPLLSQWERPGRRRLTVGFYAFHLSDKRSNWLRR